MSVIKCKMCGGSIELSQGTTVAVCEYCGTRQTLPKCEVESVTNLFNRANNLRQKCEFDKAAELYEKIVEKDDSEAEAHWGIVLCKFGIEYVEDPVSHRRVPTCHRTLYEAVTKDTDYLAALDYSDIYQQGLYEAEAKEIDRIQRAALDIVEKEAPFDVFLCYKETDVNGSRTFDSALTNDIYYALSDAGYKVFYAPITLEDKLGQDYEPFIFAALKSAKVMLVIGTKPEYLSSPWVKNEWSRFLKMMKGQPDKRLIPCYRDMSPYDLPEDFSHFQALDISKIGFIIDLKHGIEKILGSVKAEDRAADRPAVVIEEKPDIDLLIDRASFRLEEERWDEAENLFSKALDYAPKNARANLGKLLAIKRLHDPSELMNVPYDYVNELLYIRAVRYADKALAEELNSYARAKQEREKREKDEFEKKVSPVEKALTNSLQIEEKQNAIAKTKNLLADLKDELADLLIVLREKDDLHKSNNQLENKCSKLLSEKENLSVFKRKEKKEIDEQIERAKEEIDANCVKLKKVEKKIESKKSEQYLDKKIAENEQYLNRLEDELEELNKGISYREAIAVLQKDSRVKDDILKRKPILALTMKNDDGTINFGRLSSGNGHTTVSIKWRVLFRSGFTAVLISENALINMPYHDKSTPVDWTSCSLRAWLNTEFLNTAFSAGERNAIIPERIVSNVFNTSGGSTNVLTEDKVFIPAIADYREGNIEGNLTICLPTKDLAEQIYGSHIAPCKWWLRDADIKQKRAFFIGSDGKPDPYGEPVSYKYAGVRPMINVNFNLLEYDWTEQKKEKSEVPENERTIPINTVRNENPDRSFSRSFNTPYPASETKADSPAASQSAKQELQAVLDNVKELLAEGKYTDAGKICVHLLEHSPTNPYANLYMFMAKNGLRDLTQIRNEDSYDLSGEFIKAKTYASPDMKAELQKVQDIILKSSKTTNSAWYQNLVADDKKNLKILAVFAVFLEIICFVGGYVWLLIEAIIYHIKFHPWGSGVVTGLIFSLLCFVSVPVALIGDFASINNMKKGKGQYVPTKLRNG